MARRLRTARLRLGDRLDAVRAQIRRHLGETAPGPVRVVSACAGDGRDLLGVLAERSDAGRVEAVLIEQDEGLATRAEEAASQVRSTVEVRRGDAASSDLYVDAVPADLVLLCGIFGNISDADVRTLVGAARHLCAVGAEVVWTRHRWAPDLTSTIRGWFGDNGFEEVAFVTPGVGDWAVGVHRLSGDAEPLEPGRHWFDFLR